MITNIREIINRIPKVELHIHIEGAIPLKTLVRFIKRKPDNKSGICSIRDLKVRLKYKDFGKFIETWTWKNSFIESEADFREIAYNVLAELSGQNVKYVEAFYSPGDFWRQKLNVEDITANLLMGIRAAECEFDIQCNLIIDLIRDHGPDRSYKYLEAAAKFLGQGVIGIGLGGSENLFPADPYAEIYNEARNMGFHLTAHAGEVSGPESVWTVIDRLGVQRIGHATRACEDQELITLISAKQIPLEICPTSNLRTGVVKNIKDHPVGEYYRNNLLISINSDDPTMFNTSINDEYLVLYEKLRFKLGDLKHLSFNGIKSSFLSSDEKKTLTLKFEHEWDILLETIKNSSFWKSESILNT